jgi:hypothetical protein
LSKLLTALLLLTFILSGCSNDVEEVPMTEEHSPYSVGQVQVIGNSNSLSVEPEFWSEIKNHSKVDMRICIRDRASQINLVDEPFDVVDERGRVVNKFRKTDHDGCLFWTVEQSFDFLKQEKFFNKTYRLRSMGAFQFERKVRLAFNPWNGEILDLDRQSHDGVRTDALSLLRPFKNIDIRDFELERIEEIAPSTNDEGRIRYQYRGSFRPFFLRRGLDGDIVDQAILKGLFKLELQIIEFDVEKEKYFEIGRKTINDRSAHNGLLEFQTEIAIHPDGRSNQDNPLYLWAEVVPEGPLETFSGVQMMEGIQRLKNNQIIDIQSLKPGHHFGFLNKDIEVPRTVVIPSRSERENAGTNNTIGGVSITPIGSVETIRNEISGKRVKLMDVQFTDGGNINRFDTTDHDHRVRRVDIRATLFDELAGESGQVIQNGEFKVDIEIVSDQTKDKYDGVRMTQILGNGQFDTFVYVPFQLYGKERNIYFDLILTGQSGLYKDRIIKKRLSYNPWSKRGFDTDRLPPEEIVGAKHPQIKLSEIELQWPRIDFQDNMLIDRHMNLGFNLDFHTTLEMFYDREKNIGEDEKDLPIEFGNYEVEAFLFTPKRDNVSYYQQPDYQMKIEDFTLVTASHSSGTIVKGKDKGFLEVKLSFPFTISEMPIQHLKNLLVLHLRPLDKYNKLRPLTIATPFSARAKHQKETHLGHLPDLYENIRSGLPFYENYMEDGLRYKMKRIVDLYQDVDSLDVYRQKLSDDFGENYFALEWKDFLDEVSRNSVGLRTGHLKDIHKGRDSRHTIAKSACRYHYIKTLKLNHPDTKANHQKWKRLNAEFVHCLDNPRDYFQVVPTAHIQKVLDEKTFMYGEDSLAKGQFVNQIPYQEIQKGKTFFAGTGERIAAGTGTRESDQLVLSAKASAETPAPFYLNVSVMKNKVYEAYEFQSKNNYVFDANRHYQTIINNAEFEMLEVKLNAEVKRCVKIFNPEYVYHICYDRLQRQDVTEKWFQISTEYHQGARGVITDGEIHQGQSSGYQLIRGSYNFASQWNTYMGENRLVVEDITEKIEIPRSYEENPEMQGQNIPYESLIQNAFPGTYVQPIQSLSGP